MKLPGHQGIYLAQATDSNTLIESLIAGKILLPGLALENLKPSVFSDRSLKLFLDEEFLHGGLPLESEYRRPLHQMSSGEQKRALLHQLIFQQADYFILDELYDHIDLAGQASILETISLIAQTKIVIQIVHRKKDALPFICQWSVYENSQLMSFDSLDLWSQWLDAREPKIRKLSLPQPLKTYPTILGPLVAMKGVSVTYDEKPIVQNIEWTIQPDEFWQLVGPNGTGKSTLLSLISGDNPKGYGQALYLFGRKKGSGETVWDIKKNIGYFNSSITLHFTRLDSIEKMIISGFNDSIGLYVVPTDQQLRLAGEWLHFIGLYAVRNKPIQFLPLAQQRMVLIARAMVKHPPLVILDEPTAGLDDAGAALVIQMIKQIAAESTSAILYVSHSKEAGLDPDQILELHPTEAGSIGVIHSK